ncbi:MAG: GLUG motif-containing protein [Sedimentisphaerales bacterium]
MLDMLSFSSFAKYSGGTGIAGDPYRIANHTDLYALADDANDYNKCFIMTNDINLAPNLPGRRTLTKALIAPETNNVTYFTGTFDGNNYNILNLKINGKDCLGLFGRIGSGSSVHNLGIRDINIVGTGLEGGGLAAVVELADITACCVTGTVTMKGNYAGGLVGYIFNGHVTNCYTNTVINGKGDYVGGLFGYEDWSPMISCYSTGAVKGSRYVGGLVGESEDGNMANCYSASAVTGTDIIGGLVGNASAQIRNCYSIGRVISDGNYVGGLVGNRGYAYIYSSFWNIESSGKSVNTAGGIGMTTSQMHHAFYFAANNWGGTTWTIDEGNDYPHLAWENAPGEFITDPVVTMPGSGTVDDPWLIESKDNFLLVCAGSFFWDKHYVLNTDIELSGVTYTHGLIGYDKCNAFTASFDGNGHIIRNLTVSGKDYLGLFGVVGERGSVSNLDLEDVNVTSTGRYVGGLVGYADSADVIYCYAAGKVSGYDRVGGLAGFAEDSDVTYCYATGEVMGMDDLIGGLVGHVYDGSVSNSSAESLVSGSTSIGGLVGEAGYADVTTCYATSVVNGISYVGGLAGVLWNNNARNCSATGSVTGDGNYIGGLVGYADYAGAIYCYATGAVIGEGNYVGGLVGYQNSGMVTSSFWDVNTTGQLTSAGGKGKTTAEMKTESTFTNAGWDFVWETANGSNDIWAICESVSYPKLAWQYKVGDSDNDKDVDFSDFATLAGKWIQADSTLYCGGSDLTGDGFVDLEDLYAFAENWLQKD